MSETLPKGTRVRITLSRWESYTGAVLEATNYGDEGAPNWHVLFTHDRPVPGHLGPGSYKQREDGGTLEVLA